MSIFISSVRTPLGQGEQEAVSRALRRLRTARSQVKRAYVTKTSLDARRREKICLVHTVCVELFDGELEAVKAASDSSVVYRGKREIAFPVGCEKLDHPVVIAGFGPAGMFAALLLAQKGYRPIVLERGGDVDSRVRAVEKFWLGGALSPDSNVQFGEGGAGTFSDGKLTTRISDPLCDIVLDEFVRHGAPEEIRRRAKPHIGTDRLRGVVKSIRQEILSLGGQVRFHSRLEGIRMENGRLRSIVASGEEIAASALLLAIGHSARDTFEMLDSLPFVIEPKTFSVGARIEHLQSEIDRGLYGEHAGHPLLPKGEYQLSHRDGERGVYTFCMCPGGFVVPSSSQEAGVVTNGMSEYARDGVNANAALVVNVSPADFGSHPLDGVRFQQALEQAAFARAGGDYRAPAVTAGEFLEGKAGLKLRRVQPTYARGVTACDFDRLFPPAVVGRMREGLRRFGAKLPGYDAADAVLTAPETRTSSPLRILRSEDFSAVGMPGVYPCGEGAGYAGGIVSAAVDGIRAARALIARYRPE